MKSKGKAPKTRKFVMYKIVFGIFFVDFFTGISFFQPLFFLKEKKAISKQEKKSKKYQKNNET